MFACGLAHAAEQAMLPTMPHGSLSLGEIARRRAMLRLACLACGRRGQYRVDRLLKRFPPSIALPDLRHELAQCPRRGSMSEPCQVGYVDSIEGV
jgi:hypothetical protein